MSRRHKKHLPGLIFLGFCALAGSVLGIRAGRNGGFGAHKTAGIHDEVPELRDDARFQALNRLFEGELGKIESVSGFKVNDEGWQKSESGWSRSVSFEIASIPIATTGFDASFARSGRMELRLDPPPHIGTELTRKLSDIAQSLSRPDHLGIMKLFLNHSPASEHTLALQIDDEGWEWILDEGLPAAAFSVSVKSLSFDPFTRRHYLSSFEAQLARDGSLFHGGDFHKTDTQSLDEPALQNFLASEGIMRIRDPRHPASGAL